MSDIGIGLVNAQAANITRLDYPPTSSEAGWVVIGKTGQGEDGYDLYKIERGDEVITVPANRLVFLARLLETLA